MRVIQEFPAQRDNCQGRPRSQLPELSPSGAMVPFPKAGLPLGLSFSGKRVWVGGVSFLAEDALPQRVVAVEVIEFRLGKRLCLSVGGLIDNIPGESAAPGGVV